MNICEHVPVLSALGSYFKKQYGLEGSSRRTLTIFLCPYNDFPSELKTAEKEQVAVLLQVLAVADGRILIDNMTVQLLDEAVRHFNHQRGSYPIFPTSEQLWQVSPILDWVFELAL
jgi:hypothetical protein